jgi:gliding motility-associated-like protein
LGNNLTGAQAEKVRYYFHVPPIAHYILIYRYAIVLQDPGHPVSQQPRFEVNLYDSVSGVPCASYSYISSSGMPGFVLSPCTTCTPASTPSNPIWYHDWATASVDLSGLGGSVVTVDFATGDCAAGAHFGYAYVDMQCGLFQVSASQCDTATPLTFHAPPGYDTYTWTDSLTFTTIYGTTPDITIPYPFVPTTYAVIMHPYTGFGCDDTLYTHIIPANLQMNPSHDTAICRGRSVTLTSGATDLSALSYIWSPGTGLSCTTCANPTATPMVTTTYTVQVSDAAGCMQKDSSITVSILPNVSGALSHTNVSCYGLADGSATYTASSSGGPYSYLWSTTPPQTSPTATVLPAGVYTVVVTDPGGCTDTAVANITQPPPTVLSIVGSTNPTNCLGSDGTITVGGLTPLTSFTIHYATGGGPVNVVLTSDAAGQVTITGLTAGTYTNITALYTLCPYTITGPVSLVDPPIPDVTCSNKDGLTNLYYICEGDPINLYGNSTVAGVTYSWAGPGGYSSVAQNPTISGATLAMSGAYTVTVVKNSCYNHAVTLVDVRPNPVPSANSNSALCSGDTLRLTGSSSTGATTYIWQGPNFFMTNTQNPVINNVQTNASGIYTLAVTLNGCTKSDTVAVDVYQTPIAPSVHDTDYCQYDSSNAFWATGTNLKWYTTATGGTAVTTPPTPSTLQSGLVTWYVSQTSTDGCTSPRSKVNARIWTYPAPYVTLTDSVSCSGKYVTFTANNIGEGSNMLTWSFGDFDSIVNINPVYHAFNGVGTYTVTARANYIYCPGAVMNRTVNIFPYPTVDVGPDTAICPGSNPIELTAVVNTNGGTPAILWSTGETSNKIAVAGPGSYSAKVSVGGCETVDTVIVGKDCYLDIPNVFTPNGDGINDYFFPRQLLSRGLTKFSMSIYNRWGQLIFESHSLDGRGWDGQLNNVPQPEGVFVFTIDAEFKDGQKEHHQGNVTLLR